MANPVRAVVPLDSQDPAAWAHALAYAAAMGGRAKPAVLDYVLLTHAKQQLKSTSLAGHVGETAAKALVANKTVGIPTGGQLRHATIQTLRNSGAGAVVIAYYADEGMLETLDGLAGIVGIVAVPEFPGEVDGWIARWNPIVHGQAQASTPAPSSATSSRGVGNKALPPPRSSAKPSRTAPTILLLSCNRHLRPSKRSLQRLVFRSKPASVRPPRAGLRPRAKRRAGWRAQGK